MKRLTILLMAVCVFAAIGCQNKITNNVSEEENKAMMTIEEAGGRAVTEVGGIVEFLQSKDYSGVFFTDSGHAGYKIKNSKIYFVNEITDPDNADYKRQVWTEMSYGDISVDISLNKLQYKHPDNGLEILTFDGFGYYYYIDGGNLPKYYKKYDYVEDKYSGTWINTTDKGDIKKVEIYEDYMRRHVKPDSNNKWGSYQNLIQWAPFKGDTLTLKGLDGHKIVFNSDQKTATYYYSDGSSDTITKQ